MVGNRHEQLQVPQAGTSEQSGFENGGGGRQARIRCEIFETLMVCAKTDLTLLRDPSIVIYYARHVRAAFSSFCSLRQAPQVMSPVISRPFAGAPALGVRRPPAMRSRCRPAAHPCRQGGAVLTRFFGNLLSALACMTLVGAAASAGTLQGRATYRERLMLPPDAVFEARLQDIARADAPATVLGRARLDPAGQPPFNFEIAYDDAALSPRGRYTVSATITHRGQLLFTTDRLHPVLDGRNGPLELRLVSARRQAAPAAGAGIPGALPASFEGDLPGAGNPIRWHVDLFPEGRFQLRTVHLGRPEPNQFDDIGRWSREADSGRLVLRGGREAPVFMLPVDGGAALRKLDLQGRPVSSAHPDQLQRQPRFVPIEPRLFLNGMFATTAGAPSIVLCADRRAVPVAIEADYQALAAAYARAHTKPGERTLVSLEGLLAPRPSMETGQPPRTTLVVERFVGVFPGQRCGGPPAPAPRTPNQRMASTDRFPLHPSTHAHEEMMTYTLAKSAAVLAMAGLVGACSSLNPFTRIDGTNASLLSKMEGSWTVLNTGGTKVEGVNPPPTIVFNTADRSVSGFDGCNDFKGSYSFEAGLLKANVADTRRACTSEMANTVSKRINDLFRQGAEVIDTTFMAANVLMLRNASGDVRMGPTSALQKT